MTAADPQRATVLHRCGKCDGVLDSAGVCHWCKVGTPPSPEARAAAAAIDKEYEAEWLRSMTRDEESEYYGEAGHGEAHLEDPPEEEEESDQPKD